MNWWKVGTAIVMMGVLIWMYSSSRAGINEANNIREHGWYYIGTTQITQEQADYLLKKYNGFHSGAVDVIETNPLTIQYGFATTETISYLTQKPMTFWDIQTEAIGNDAILIMFIIPILIMFSAFPFNNNANNGKEKQDA